LADLANQRLACHIMIEHPQTREAPMIQVTVWLGAPMPADDATKDVITDYDMAAEMHGTGEITDGAVHVHATMAVAGDRGVAGHLHRAEIGTWFARVYVLPA
jgi:predicted DNA-binding protein with PD1-like motif